MVGFLKTFSWRLFVGSLLQAFGTLWVITEIAYYFLKKYAWAEVLTSNYWALAFLLIGLTVGAKRAWPKQYVRAKIKGTDVVVEVRVGDLFRLDGAIVVGSNTTFDTSIEDTTISANSVQGQFTEKCFANVRELDDKLSIALQASRPVRVRTTKENDKPYGKLEAYDLGTVAPVKGLNRKAYFVAVAELNEHRTAGAKLDDFLSALPRMWDEIRRKGDMEPLCCPILGSGFTRLPVPKQVLVTYLIRTFVTAARERRFSNKLTIVIHPQDMENGQISLEELGRSLEYECTYAIASDSI